MVTEADELTQHDRNAPAYAALLGTYAAFLAGALAVGRRRGIRLPAQVPTRDVVLVSIATHKLARLITKDKVSRPLRKPFTTVEEPGAPAELNEAPKGSGLRRAVGELVSCPFCVGVWLATAFTAGLVLAPRVTRLAASMLTAVAGSDFLQFAYAAAERIAEGDGSR